MMMFLWKEKEGRTKKPRTRAKAYVRDRGGETRKSKETGKARGKRKPGGKDDVLRTAVCHSRICAFPWGKQQGGGSILLPRV
jgi:hypothetical protein